MIQGETGVMMFLKLERNWCRLSPDRGRQDKKPHFAALTVDCFVYGFSDFPHIAPCHRNVRSFIFTNSFNKNRTFQIQTP
jgi:hypothetical protein